MKPILHTALCLILSFSMVEGQFLERKVFSSGGGSAVIGPDEYLYTIGEAVIGTTPIGSPHLTKGFHQPVMVLVLGMEVRHFNGQLDDEGIQFQWQAHNTDPSAYFVLERAIHGEAFQEIAQIPALAMENIWMDYPYLDPIQQVEQPLSYRLKAFWANGRQWNSDVLWFHPTETNSSFLAYPNPASDFIQVDIPASQHGASYLSLWNVNGQMIWKSELPENTFSHQINLTDLPGGSYVLRLQQAGVNEYKKILVRH